MNPGIPARNEEEAMRDDREAQPIASITWLFTLALVAVTVCVRLAPYLWAEGTETRWLWNLAPTGALALFAGSRLRSRWAFLVPLAAMLISDLLLIRPLAARGQPAFTLETPLVYGCFLLYVVA